MKSFKTFIKENLQPRTKEEMQARSAQVDRDIATSQAKNAENLASQKAASEARAAESDKAAGREWADSKIDPIQKGVDYAATGLAATQVGKPLAAVAQGFSSAIDLTQGQYGDATSRAVGAVVNAVPGSEIAKGVQTAISPLSSGVKAAITSGAKTIGDKILTSPTAANLVKTGLEKATEKIGQEAVKGTINVSQKLATKAATDLTTSKIKQLGSNLVS